MSRFLAKLLNITGLYSASEPPPRVVAGTACNCGPGFCADATLRSDTAAPATS